jgi:lysophospholipase L1-like esterase
MGLAQLSPHREDPELAMNMGLFKQILLQAKALVGTWGGRLYFVYLPERQRYAYPKTASNDRDAVLTMLKSVGIPFIDMHLVFQAQSHPLDLFPFRIGFHYNAEGYRLIAEEVLHSVTLDPSK